MQSLPPLFKPPLLASVGGAVHGRLGPPLQPYLAPSRGPEPARCLLLPPALTGYSKHDLSSTANTRLGTPVYMVRWRAMIRPRLSQGQPPGCVYGAACMPYPRGGCAVHTSGAGLHCGRFLAVG